jgi:3-methyladenine DNA glycosylase AlkD
MHPLHKAILNDLHLKVGKPVQDPVLDKYLGNPHPKFRLRAAGYRSISRAWLKSHPDLTANEFAAVLTSMFRGKTSTEKCLAGLMVNSCRAPLRAFDPAKFSGWLDHLVGWGEVDTLCTGRYPEKELLAQWAKWKKLLDKFILSKNISKRRASLVLLCSPLRRNPDPRLLKQALQSVNKLKNEREILITKAVSWVLRSASVHFKGEVKKYVTSNRDSLPAIAVRETMTKILTGTKTKKKKTT